MMEKLKYAQHLIKTKDSSVDCGFNMFIGGNKLNYSDNYSDFGLRSVGYDEAERMAKEDGIAHVHNFGCYCGGSTYIYGGFFKCNTCHKSGVDKDWWSIKVEKDGDSFCCHGLDFVNLQESNNYAFGDSFYEAIEEYRKLMFEMTKD
jgi:hypothetical protein